MHDFLPPDQIAERAQAIELPLHLLAQRAGVHRTTLVRGLAGETEMKISSLRRLTEVLIQRERQLLTHLLALHGVPAADEQHEAAA